MVSVFFMSNIYLTSSAARSRLPGGALGSHQAAFLLQQAPFALVVLAVLALAWLA
jgi:hypothetical protein